MFSGLLLRVGGCVFSSGDVLGLSAVSSLACEDDVAGILCIVLGGFPAILTTVPTGVVPLPVEHFASWRAISRSAFVKALMYSLYDSLSSTFKACGQRPCHPQDCLPKESCCASSSRSFTLAMGVSEFSLAIILSNAL